ncbi:hypothetical protein NEMIN01_2511, partial [Nematocida minor]|uniref:uncharacterized protein n=1 Tax=Nematocida minor TaxID=1912983 RepID=UPI00222057E5
MKLKEVLCISGILALFVTECRGENDNSDIIDITDELVNKGKRKASEIAGSKKDLTSQQKQKKKAGNEIENPKLNEKEVKKGMNSLDFSLWGKRLDNSRRKKYNLTADIVWKNESLEKDIKNIEKNICYQEELNSNIEDFSSAVPDTTDKKFLCFMAYNSTAINAKYKECFGLKALHRYKAFNNIKLLEKFKEYYSRAFDDLIEYIKKNRPMHTPKSKVITEWKETFGDIYMRKCLDVDKFMSSEQKVIHELKNKHQQTLA